jgi:hypothetical protein
MPNSLIRSRARQVLRFVVATAIVWFSIALPAYADVIVVENEEQLAKIKLWLNAHRQGYLEASNAMAPCYQPGQHQQCEKSMKVAIGKNLPSAILVAATGVTHYLEPIRNNVFRYERAFSLLFLNALVQRPGATCADFNREAAFPSPTGQTLADRLAAAKAEIGNRTYLPEYQMLLRVTSILGPCVAGA